jgi:hypothetical protein
MIRAILLAALLPLAGAARADTLIPFHTPSGNIHCMGLVGEGGSLVDCEIIELGTAPLRPCPADCDLDWGHRFLLGVRTHGEMVCAGDTVRDPHGMVLPYGSRAQFGQITCASSERGLECRNPSGGGFFLSRTRQALY